MYGYDVAYGFIGWVERLNKFMTFASYRDYVEYVKED